MQRCEETMRFTEIPCSLMLQSTHTYTCRERRGRGPKKNNITPMATVSRIAVVGCTRPRLAREQKNRCRLKLWLKHRNGELEEQVLPTLSELTSGAAINSYFFHRSLSLCLLFLFISLFLFCSLYSFSFFLWQDYFYLGSPKWTMRNKYRQGSIQRYPHGDSATACLS